MERITFAGWELLCPPAIPAWAAWVECTKPPRARGEQYQQAKGARLDTLYFFL